MGNWSGPVTRAVSWGCKMDPYQCCAGCAGGVVELVVAPEPLVPCTIAAAAAAAVVAVVQLVVWLWGEGAGPARGTAVKPLYNKTKKRKDEASTPTIEK